MINRGLIKKILPEVVVERIRFHNVLRRLKKIKKSEDFKKLHPEIRDVKKNLKNPLTLFDIGANVGEISFYLSKEFPSAKIYSFEPGNRAFNIIRKIKRRFNLNNLSIYKLALGDKKEFVGMKLPEEDDGRAFIMKGTNLKGEFRVEKLDDFVKIKGVGNIDFIKIDVEGFEIKVLKGGIKTIKKYRPLILMEVDDDNQKRFNHSAKELLEFMKKLRYDWSWQGATDYLFIPK